MKKIMIFHPPSVDPFVFSSTQSKTKLPLISTMKAQKLLDSGCTGYLANVANTLTD